IVDKLKLIPELAGVTITAYDQSFPVQNDYSLAIWQMLPPMLLVDWTGSGSAAKGSMEVWMHNFKIYMRSDAQKGPQYARNAMCLSISNGHVNGDGPSFRKCSLHESVYAMEIPPIERRTIFITQDSRLDYDEVLINVTEKGDY